MIASARLGVRLAGVGVAAGAGRMRSVLVALTGLVGTLLMLAVLAIAHAEGGRTDHGLVSESGTSLLLASVVVTVALPVLVLAATVGRLAAAMRDRRLANLRLLGLSPARTRIVAAVETGVAAAVGVLLGGVVFLGARPALAVWHPAGRGWTVTSLDPTVAGYVVVLLAVPAAVTLASALPARQGTRRALAVARRSADERPGWWRLVLLLAGVALATYVLTSSDPARANDRSVPYLFAAIIALALGMVLTVPVFVRLVADVLVRRGSRPLLVIAGRRLQHQPAATTRLVAGLLIGLFLVTGARAVVVAFEQTPQYQSAAAQRETGQIATFFTSPEAAASVRQQVGGLTGIRTTQEFAVLPGCGAPDDCSGAPPPQFLVGSCADLADVFGPLPECRDDEPAWLVGPGAAIRQDSPTQLPLRRPGTTSGPSVAIPAATYRLPERVTASLDAEVFLPRTMPGAEQFLDHPRALVLAAAQPGVELSATLPGALGPPGSRDFTYSTPDPSYYNFVAGLRELVWTVATVVLSVGLLGFAIGAVDRAVTRRSELISLQLTGVEPRLLRLTQAVEVALPLLGGLVLAIGLGALAGATYLAFGSELQAVPWRPTMTLAGVSVVAALLVTALTVVGASPRIRPELIRTE